MNCSDTLTKIAPALVAALGKIEGAAKTKANPGFKGTKYADLETVIAASRDILTENGLTIIQLPGACALGILNLETIFMHESGEWISGEMGIALGKTDPQGVGSALTYARRYAQMAALNMPAVDDDGERAMGRVNGAAAPSIVQPIATNMGRKSSAQAKRDGDHERYTGEIDKLNEAGIIDWLSHFDEYTSTAPLSWLDPLKNRLQLRHEELSGADSIQGEADAMDEAFRASVGPGRASGMAGDNDQRAA